MAHGDRRWAHDIRIAAVGNEGGIFGANATVVELGSADIFKDC